MKFYQISVLERLHDSFLTHKLNLPQSLDDLIRIKNNFVLTSFVGLIFKNAHS